MVIKSCNLSFCWILLKKAITFQLLVATVLQDDVTAYIKYIKDLTVIGDVISSNTNGSGSGGSQIDLR